jgi:hypothetical protein
MVENHYRNTDVRPGPKYEDDGGNTRNDVILSFLVLAALLEWRAIALRDRPGLSVPSVGSKGPSPSVRTAFWKREFAPAFARIGVVESRLPGTASVIRWRRIYGLLSPDIKVT